MAFGKKVCITSSPDQSCVAPCSKDESCLTLDQYFLQEYMRNTSDPFSRNITLELLPGTHSLELGSLSASYYTLSHKDFFEITSDNATIICSNSSRDILFNISTVQINRIEFIDCNFFTFWVNWLSIENSIILRNYYWLVSYRSAAYTSQVSIVGTSFVDGFTLEVSCCTLVVRLSTFINLTTRHTCANGGAIRFNGNNLTVQESTFQNNSAIGTTCSESKWLQGGSGGAIYVSFQSNLKVRVSSSDFFGNNATHSGGALSVQGGSVGIFNSSISSNWGGRYAGALLFQSSLHGGASIASCNFTYNVAGMKGGVLYISDSFFDISVSLSSSTFSYNSVREQPGEGGVAYVFSDSRYRACNVSILRSNFIHNTVPGNAGVLYITSGGVPIVIINESSFAHNRADGSGGVVHITSDNHIVIALNQSSFVNNQADEDGGVMYLKSNSTYSWPKDRSLINIDSKSNFTFNTAIRSGGIFTVYSNKGQLDIQTTQICCSNTANLGGVIKACNFSNILMQNKLFSRSDPTDMQCTLYDSLYAITSPTTTQPPQTPTVCDNTSIHRKNTILASLFALLSVLFFILSSILMCITFYLCGVCKRKVGTKSYTNNHSVYIPMNESEGTPN